LNLDKYHAFQEHLRHHEPPMVITWRTNEEILSSRRSSHDAAGLGERRASTRGAVAGTHREDGDLQVAGRGPTPRAAPEHRRRWPGRPGRPRRRASRRLRL